MYLRRELFRTRTKAFPLVHDFLLEKTPTIRDVRDHRPRQQCLTQAREEAWRAC